MSGDQHRMPGGDVLRLFNVEPACELPTATYRGGDDLQYPHRLAGALNRSASLSAWSAHAQPDFHHTFLFSSLMMTFSVLYGMGKLRDNDGVTARRKALKNYRTRRLIWIPTRF